ncbi:MULTISPECIES: glycoside hydrolase family 65 protein [unclassified Enterococcus]|uniref:glycoside hydrolase family 65 protein n=1 Tax=unclassified Enterococcus TaxID=2608891 RepID=UPI001554E04E|nr:MULTISPECIES: glycoside hydrolase family 65 protein [unclassified Enterococcus]MBS7576451.1 glycoside hydrolase family 65 protein [Enterococcus sp. MMGLQ5-2]MBS7583683.1 glycoside hydrolase family 65 protein [Enterococcus sp. MMGLQ5-1]NPD11544.1 glycoside hydrolase family 65 protein [Enterococcus sp. MMGLQ5-1]NPD36288.1 glycoside hydrolase family 65 protein [Enterococcus sp. MMGLQ5-2]
MVSNLRYISSSQIEEIFFNEAVLPKFESLMAQGNGYLEVRNSLEESYRTGSRGMFVAGVFNQYSNQEVIELANFPDLLATSIKVNGQIVDLKLNVAQGYSRKIDYKTGETIRHFYWSDGKGLDLEITFKRFVSMANQHLIVNQISLQANQACQLEIESGINGQITNSGSQHFEEGEKRYHQDQYLQLVTETSNTRIPISLNCVHRLNQKSTKRITMNRRQLKEMHSVNLSANQCLDYTKYCLVFTGRDIDYTENSAESYLREMPLEMLSEVSQKSYEALFQASKEKWSAIWQNAPIKITAADFKDELMLNFARYHLHAMSPVHDSRMNIGAKGMTGEGYKGHTFWDTEIFILPYFTYNYPQSAKHLIEYRIQSLAAAQKNAQANGFQGAQYPWESAWLTDGEVTPKFGGIDIVSGKPTPVLTGDLEHHVTGDVVFGAAEYISITGDASFKAEILPMVIQCAIFWSTRAAWNETKQRYEINEVIGPDEYTEHVNNNAYTNYMAKYTIDLALEYIHADSDMAEMMISKSAYQRLMAVSSQLYLPIPNETQVIPQDDTFLSKPIIDLRKYLETEEVLTILGDYNMSQINNLQVLKQADVVLLLLLFPEKFSKEVKLANWNYYYPKTLHDSSLSKSSHCNLALMLDEVETAYELFRSNFVIDLSDRNMNSSNDGVHAASLGGIWQNVILGFGGLRIHENQLSLTPKLPKNWDKLEYMVKFKQQKINVVITHNQVALSCDDNNSEIELVFMNQKVKFQDTITLYY